MKNNKAIFCFTVKNEEKSLKKKFALIDKVKLIFKDYHLVYVLSDCTDNSERMISSYLKNNNYKGKLIIKNFNSNEKRLLKLEKSRNAYLDYIKSDDNLKKYDYLLVMDVDGVNNLLNTKKLTNSLNSRINWTAIFANQELFYYDLFALRIKGIFEENCFDEILKNYLNNKKFPLNNLFKEKLLKNFKIIKKHPDNYIKVESAFGGFGIYKLINVINSKAYYCSNNGKDCEHIHFNKLISKKYDGLFIDKQLTNSIGLNTHVLNAFLCSYFEIFAKRFIKKIS